MRTVLFAWMMLIGIAAGAQTILQESSSKAPVQKDSAISKKWIISKYMGVSSSLVFFNGGNASILSVPVGIRLNRRINNNWYAFAGVSVAPSYINFNGAFLNSQYSKTAALYSYSGNGHFNVNPAAELGLVYTNDQKTFSISGSISVQRQPYAFLPYSAPALSSNNFFIPR